MVFSETMKAQKLLSIYYWTVLSTIFIYAIRTYYIDWIEKQTYLKQYGNLDNLPLRCYPLPPIFIDIIIFSIIAVAFFLTRELKKQVSAKSKLNSEGYSKILLLTLFVIIPFLFVDLKLLELIYNATRDYFLAQPIRV